LDFPSCDNPFSETEEDMQSSFRVAGILSAVILLLGPVIIPSSMAAPPQQTQQNPPPKPPISHPPPDMTLREPAPIKKISDTLMQLANVMVDTQKKEVTVPGHMLPDQTMEFLATKKGGMKSYESVLELDTDAVTFNLALILIGLEKSRAVAPQGHFDPKAAAGDPVEIFVEWGSGENARKVRGEELLYDLQTKKVVSMGGWVYTGSTVLPDGRYMAEMDGVLIGFVHDPASIIENSVGGGIGAYGSIRLNPDLKLAEGTPIKLTVRALPRQK
jgi:hypothetical protein